MSWRPMVTTEFTASLMSSAAKEEGMVGLKQRPNTATDSATGPMTEVTTPDPTGALQGGGQPLPLLPESDGGSSDWATSFPARSHRRRDGYDKRQHFRAAA